MLPMLSCILTCFVVCIRVLHVRHMQQYFSYTWVDQKVLRLII